MTKIGTKHGGLGWKPELPSAEDWHYGARILRQAAPITYPKQIIVPNVEQYCPRKDQGQTSSCVGQSCTYMFQHEMQSEEASALKAYWDARLFDHSNHRDEGAFVRNGVKGLAHYGLGSEKLWPMVEDKVNHAPSRAENADARKHKIADFFAIDTIEDMKHTAATGHCFVMGMTCYTDFVTAGTITDKTGIVHTPQTSREKEEGGHSMMFFDIDSDFKNSKIAENARRLRMSEDLIPTEAVRHRGSWGNGCGLNGDFWVDSRILQDRNLSDDGWTARKIANNR